jgi:hypothetical protein
MLGKYARLCGLDPSCSALGPFREFEITVMDPLFLRGGEYLDELHDYEFFDKGRSAWG